MPAVSTRYQADPACRPECRAFLNEQIYPRLEELQAEKDQLESTIKELRAENRKIARDNRALQQERDLVDAERGQAQAQASPLGHDQRAQDLRFRQILNRIDEVRLDHADFRAETQVQFRELSAHDTQITRGLERLTNNSGNHQERLASLLGATVTSLEQLVEAFDGETATSSSASTPASERSDLRRLRQQNIDLRRTCTRLARLLRETAEGLVSDDGNAPGIQ